MESALPVEASALLVTHLFGSLDDAGAADNFAISAGDNQLIPRPMSSGSHKPHDPIHTGLLCFRTLRSNPAQMKMLPGAPRIQDHKACVAVLEHVVARSDIASCRIMQTTDEDLDDRTIVIAPTTFEYNEIRCMRRAKLEAAPTYDFGDDAQCNFPGKCAPRVITDVIHGLLHTMMLDGHNDFCYSVTATSARREEQLEVLETLQRLDLVTLVRGGGASDDDTHWAISALGRVRLRITYSFRDVENMIAPLLGRAPNSRMEAAH